MSEEIEALRQRILALAPTTVTRPTLVYFDIIGIAWPIRCLLHLQQVDYELIQISVQQWNYRDAAGEQVLKRSFTNGHVPLYVDQQIRILYSSLSRPAPPYSFGQVGVVQPFSTMRSSQS